MRLNRGFEQGGNNGAVKTSVPRSILCGCADMKDEYWTEWQKNEYPIEYGMGSFRRLRYEV